MTSLLKFLVRFVSFVVRVALAALVGGTLVLIATLLLPAARKSGFGRKVWVAAFHSVLRIIGIERATYAI